MRSDRINYLVVGSFVLAMVAALVATLAVLTGRTGATDTYFARFRDVTGLQIGTQVLYMGYPVGRVEGIEPVRTEAGLRYDVALSVKAGWRIPEDSVVKITAPGLLSAFTVDVRAGESQSALEPGAHIAAKESAGVFTAVQDTADLIHELAEQTVQPLLVDLNRYVQSFGELLERDVSGIVDDLDTLTGALARDAPGILANFRAASVRLEATSARLEEMLGPANTERVAGTLENVEVLSANLREASKEVTAASGELRRMLGAESREKVHRALDNVEAASANVLELTSRLDSTREQLDRVLAVLGDALGESGDDLGESIRHLRHILATISRDIDTMTYNLQGTARNMYEFSREIRRNPGLLLRGAPPADAGARTQ